MVIGNGRHNTRTKRYKTLKICLQKKRQSINFFSITETYKVCYTFQIDIDTGSINYISKKHRKYALNYNIYITWLTSYCASLTVQSKGTVDSRLYSILLQTVAVGRPRWRITSLDGGTIEWDSRICIPSQWTSITIRLAHSMFLPTFIINWRSKKKTTKNKIIVCKYKKKSYRSIK